MNYSSKKRQLRESDFEKPENIVFRWFLSKRSQNFPLVGNVIKEKAIGLQQFSRFIWMARLIGKR